MSKINIKYLSDETTETIRSNFKKYTKIMMDNSEDSSWIENVAPGKTYIDKKYLIDDFQLKEYEYLPSHADSGLKKEINIRNKEIYVENMINLYEHLNNLPNYVLTSEQFWLWIMFDKCYKTVLQMAPIKNEDSKVLEDHWFFTQGERRGIFFGVLSREYFGISLTVDNFSKDKFELSRYFLENPERLRNLTWRSFSNEPHIAKSILRAEKKIYDEYKDVINPDGGNIHRELSKEISRMGSVKLLDVMDENYIEKYVYDIYKKLIQKNIQEKNNYKFEL